MTCGQLHKSGNIRVYLENREEGGCRLTQTVSQLASIKIAVLLSFKFCLFFCSSNSKSVVEPVEINARRKTSPECYQEVFWVFFG